MAPRHSSSSNQDSDTPELQSKKCGGGLLKYLAQSSGKKRRITHIDRYKQFSKWIARSEDLFVEYSAVLDVGIQFEGEEYGELDKDSFEKENARPLYFFRHLRRYIVGFEKDLDELGDDIECIQELAKELNKAASAGRSDDINSLLHAGLDYVAIECPDGELRPKIRIKAKKSETRGFHHPVLGRLLCPVKYLHDFDANPAEFLKKLQDGSARVTGKDFPAFLYPAGGYDPDDMDSGLLCSSLLLRVFKHIFTSPSSAVRDEPGGVKTKGCQAKINGMIAVTPGSIAYAAIQACIFFSSTMSINIVFVFSYDGVYVH